MKFLLLCVLLASCGSVTKKEETTDKEATKMERSHFADRI